MQNAYYFLQLYSLYFSVVVNSRCHVLFHSSLRFANIVELVVNMHKVYAIRRQEPNTRQLHIGCLACYKRDTCKTRQVGTCWETEWIEHVVPSPVRNNLDMHVFIIYVAFDIWLIKLTTETSNRFTEQRCHVLFHSSLRFANIVELVVNMHKVYAIRRQEPNNQLKQFRYACFYNICSIWYMTDQINYRNIQQVHWTNMTK
jgi:hypothetical protein